MTADLMDLRKKIVDTGTLMFDRNLTDLAGGNISARLGDVICLTPRYSASRYHWRLRPEQVLVLDLAGNKIEGEGEISREAKAHIQLLNEFPMGTAVVHGHARNVMVFCAARRPIPPVLECTLKFGEVPVCEYAPGGAGSEELAQNIADKMRGQEERIRGYAAGVLAPWHGLFVLGHDLDAALDAAERIDVNARCILYGDVLQHDMGWLQDATDCLSATASSYE